MGYSSPSSGRAKPSTKKPSQQGAYGGAAAAPFTPPPKIKGETPQDYQRRVQLAQLLAAQQASGHQVSPATAARNADKYGIGSNFDTSDSNWAQQAYWLRDGNTDGFARQQIRTIGGKQYIGNDKDGYVGYTPNASWHLPGLAANDPRNHITKPLGVNGNLHATYTLAQQAQTPTQFIDQFIGLYKSNPTRFGQIQDLLQKGGFYGSSRPIMGVFSGGDEAAMVSAIQASIRAKEPLETYLAKRAVAVQQMGVNANPLVIQHTDPTKITGALNSNSGGIGTSVAAQTIGRNLNPAELQQYINKIHAGETTAQTTAYNLHKSDQNDPTAGAANANDAFNKAEPINAATLKAALEAEHPTEAAATKFGDAGAVIQNMLSQHLPGATA